MLTYSQGINNKQKKYGIEYSVKRNLKFTAWRTSEGNNYIGGRWTRRLLSVWLECVNPIGMHILVILIS